MLYVVLSTVSTIRRYCTPKLVQSFQLILVFMTKYSAFSSDIVCNSLWVWQESIWAINYY